MSDRSVGHRLLACAVLGLAVSGCDDPYVRELRRIPSPDGRAEVFVTETNGGATTDYVYRVLVGAPGATKSAVEVWRADHVDGLGVEWAGERLVDIRYSKARVYSFSNFVRSRDLDLYRCVVEVRLRPQSERAL